MDPTLITSIIAISGVVISALVSFGIADRTAKFQITKVRYEIQHSKAEKLAEKRLGTYPILYSLLNKLSFLIRDKKFQVEEFEKIYTSMYDWYLENGIYLSSKSNSTFWNFLKQFKKLCEGGRDALVGSLGIHKQRRKFISVLDAVELELKNEIGVFEIEYFDPNARFSSYRELMAFYRERNPDEES